MNKKIIVDFYDLRNNKRFDLEVPLSITAMDFYNGVQQIVNATNSREKMSNGYLKSENPIALLKGNKTLEEFGLHDGSTIIFQ